MNARENLWVAIFALLCNAGALALGGHIWLVILGLLLALLNVAIVLVLNPKEP